MIINMSHLINQSLRTLSRYQTIRNNVVDQFRAISTTAPLLAEPPKKKRRIDPVMFKARVERKIKKLEREIAKMEAEAKQFIPILECQPTNSDIRDLKSRPKHTMEDFQLTPGTVRAAQRLWNLYRAQESRMEMDSIRRVEAAQTHALKVMKTIDRELYDNTMTVDDTLLIPFASSHLRKETAPNPNYTPPDGYVKDITKDWVM